jgi:hypothetical protein
MAKARALLALADEGVPCNWRSLPDDRREQIRGQVLEVLAVADELQSWDGERAASIASRLLERIDNQATAEDEEMRLATMLHDGWLALVSGDTETADELHRQWAQETGFDKWDDVLGVGP